MHSMESESPASAGFGTVLTRVGPNSVVDSRDQHCLAQGHYVREALPSGLITIASRTEELADSRVSSSVSPATSFIMVLEGELVFEYGDRVFSVTSGQGIVVHLCHTEPFRRQLQPGLRLAKVHLVLTPQWWRNTRIDSPAMDCLRHLARQHLSAYHWSLSDAQQGACEALLKAAAEPDPLLRRLQTEHLSTGLMLDILQQLGGVRTPFPETLPAHTTLSPDVEKALMLMERQMVEPFTVAEIAREIGVSTRVLQRRFKQQTGLAVFEYRRKRCLDVARQLLDEGKLSIGEVAHQVGFGHVSNFTTAFRRQFGLTPAEQRRRSGV